MSDHEMEYLVGRPGDTNCIVMVRKYLDKDTADSIFSFYKNHIPWQHNQHEYKRGDFTFAVDIPRLQHYCGDHDVYTQTYAGHHNPVKTWDPVTKAMRDKIVMETNLYFDSCLINYYRDGNDHIAHHSDRECSKIVPTVVGISFGGTRKFHFKNVETGKLIKSWMNHGDSVIISGACQHEYTHGIPKQKDVGPRISITFRSLLGKHVPWNGELDD